jgi:hypothetical protein
MGLNAQRLPASDDHMRLYQELMGRGDVSEMVQRAQADLDALP